MMRFKKKVCFQQTRSSSWGMSSFTRRFTIIGSCFDICCSSYDSVYWDFCRTKNNKSSWCEDTFFIKYSINSSNQLDAFLALRVSCIMFWLPWVLCVKVWKLQFLVTDTSTVRWRRIHRWTWTVQVFLQESHEDFPERGHFLFRRFLLYWLFFRVSQEH